jgi:hypothetical protein
VSAGAAARTAGVALAACQALWLAGCGASCAGAGAGSPGGDCASLRTSADTAWQHEKQVRERFHDAEQEQHAERLGEVEKPLHEAIQAMETARADAARGSAEAPRSAERASAAYAAFDRAFVVHLRAEHADAFPELGEAYDVDSMKSRDAVEAAGRLSGKVAAACA